MQLPTIHANGTSKERLVQSLCEASQALDLAYSALKQTSPNGRDYEGVDGLRLAQAEHMDRLRRLDAIKDEIDQLTIKIDES